MGKVQSRLQDDDGDDDCIVNWPFVGREEDIKKAKELLLRKASVRISGMPKIGKSRFLDELLKKLRVSEEFKDYKLLWKDFELDDIKSTFTLFLWIENFLDCIGAKTEKEHFQRKYPDQKIACRSCDLCKSEYDRCSKQNELIQLAIDTLIDQLKQCKQKHILFLDNVDKLMDSPLKDIFLSFHKKSLKCPKLKTVIASSNKPKQLSSNFAPLELKPLDNDAILKLLYITTEERDNAENVDSDVTVTYAPDFKVFKEANRPYTGIIVRLCEGLPLAADMSGLLLTEDDCLLTPAELVEILICIRLKSLSPDNCPPDDRLDIYKEPMEQVKDMESFFNCLNEKMTGDSFTKEEAVEAAAAAAGIETSAMVTAKILKPKGLDKSILYTESISNEQRMRWHGILRECQADLRVIKDIPADGQPVKDMMLKFMKENVRMAGLDFNTEILSDPKLLEHAIRCLSCSEKTPTPVQSRESDEESDRDIRMDLLKEDLLVSKKLTSYENGVKITSAGKDTKTSPVVKVQAEIGSDKDIENSPDDDIGNAKHDKVETRYSPVEESDSSNSSSLHLEFANVRHQEQSACDEYYHGYPPPYKTLEEVAERYDNQDDESRNVFQPIVNQHNFPSVGEPPPSYSSTDPLAQNLLQERSSRWHNIDNSIPQTRSGMLGQRSHSTSSMYYQPDSQQVINGDTWIPDNSYHNLRRVHSDPVCNHAGSSSRYNLVCRPIREMETSINNSLTGPPAINYIPPNIKTGTKPASNVQPFRSNPLEHHNTELPKQCTSHRLKDLKGDIPANLTVASRAVPGIVMSNTMKGHSSVNSSEFSTFGPAAISYVSLPSGELYSEQENSHLFSLSAVSNTPNDKPAYHRSEQHQAVENNHTSSLDKQPASKTTRSIKTPTAVISPMREIEPPGVSQQHQQRTTSPFSDSMHENPPVTNTIVSSKVDRVHIEKQMQANGYRVFKEDDSTV